MSARMKSNSADPDLIRMLRFKAAMDSRLRPISSVTMAGSVAIGAGRPAAGVPPGTPFGRRGRAPCGRTAGTLVRDRRDEVVTFEDGLQRVPDQWIAPPHDFQEACTAGW